MAELVRRIQEHNTLSRRARDLWVRAQAESRRIGELIPMVMSAGVSWAELGRLLSDIDDDPPLVEPVTGPHPGASPAAGMSADKAAAAAKPHVPAQGAVPDPQVLAGDLVPDGVPSLLFQAHSVVSMNKDQEMSSRDLAVALGRNPNTIGPELCTLLREVRVQRPNGGKIKARYADNGKQLPGYTADCLREALDAYAARTSAAPAAPAQTL
ncbi:hypothetical protein ACWF94_35435 [Streptomyces sp. NPDC055078]